MTPPRRSEDDVRGQAPDLAYLIRHAVLVFEGQPPRLPPGAGRLPPELVHPGRAEVFVRIEALDASMHAALASGVWEVSAATWPAGDDALVIAGARRAVLALARRPGTGTAGAALERALSASPPGALRLGARDLELQRCLVMGILNVTPDSFSDGGRHASLDEALAHAERLIAEGADLIDVGGESTRPGASPVSEEEELARVIPVIRELARRTGVPISIDTARSAVARAALEAGARIINDVTALRRDPAMARVAAESGAPLILMHSRGTPQDMHQRAHYNALLPDVARELCAAVTHALEAGVLPRQLVLDPGIGFAKTAEQNVELLTHLGALRSLGFPLLVGASRKKFLGLLAGVESPADRVHASVAAAVMAAERGADIVRVHDVAATVQALAVARALGPESR